MPASTLAKLRVLLTVDARSMRKGLSAEIGRIRTELNDVPKMARRIGTAAAAGFGVAAAAGAALAKSVVGVASETEQARITMDSLFGSVAKGKRAFDTLQAAARKLPFTFQNILQAGRTLSVTVDNADELRKRLFQISEISARFQIPLQQAAEQFNRLASAGAASADLFRERGVNAALGIKAGMQVSAKESLKLWDKMFSRIQAEGSSAVGRLAKSWVGLVSMLQDEWRQIRQAIADAGLFEAVKAQAERIRAEVAKMLDTGLINSWAKTVSDLLSGLVRGAGDLAVSMIRNRNQIVLWGNVAVQSLQFVGRLFASLARIAFNVGQIIGHSLRGAFDLVAAGWSKIDNLIVGGINTILDGLDHIPGVNIDFRIAEAPAETFMADFREQTRLIANDMGDLKDAVVDVAGSYMDIARAAGKAATAQFQLARGGGGSAGGGGGGSGGAGGGGKKKQLMRLGLPSPDLITDWVADFAEKTGHVPKDLSHVVRDGMKKVGKEASDTLAGQLKQGGQAAIEQLLQGLMSGTTDALSVVKGLAMDIASAFLQKGINKAFKISSPSKVMRGVGENLVEGLAMGVRSRLQLARRAAGELSLAATPPAVPLGVSGPSLAAAGPSLGGVGAGSSARGGVTVHQKVNFSPSFLDPAHADAWLRRRSPTILKVMKEGARRSTALRRTLVTGQG